MSAACSSWDMRQRGITVVIALPTADPVTVLIKLLCLQPLVIPFFDSLRQARLQHSVWMMARRALALVFKRSENWLG